MARVVAFIPDLLFGSNVAGALQAAGHNVELVSDPSSAAPADVVIVDLTADVEPRLAAVREIVGTIPSLAFYSHVEADVRDRAQAAGIDVVVPRSRMAREGAALVSRLVAA
jgi:nucleoside-diphosphate-sugar epimerase